MKVLLTHKPQGAYGVISEGWLNALKKDGHDAQRWDGNLETWRNFAPVLYIGCSAHRQSIPHDDNCFVVMHVNPLSDHNPNGLNEPTESVGYVIKLSPDLVFGYGNYNQKYLWAHWEDNYGIPWVPMATAGDDIVYKLPGLNEWRDLDIGYIGGHWPYKGKSIDAFLLPMIKDQSRVGRMIEIRGWGNWPTFVQAKPATDADVTYILQRSKIAPCISEAHTYLWGFDLPERAFKAALCGALVIHDNSLVVKDFIPSAIVGRTPAEFAELCDYYLKNEKERVELASKQRQEVLKSETYSHRMAGLWRAIHKNYGDERFAVYNQADK